MPKPPGSHDPYKWTLDLPPGSLCSIGWSRSENVDSEGKSTTGRPNEDRYYTCTYQDKIQLYIVLDGHDGTRACDFVQKHLPYSVLRSNLDRGDVLGSLSTAFRNTEREFFIGIDPHITRRLTLVIEIQQKAENSHQASMLCPQQVDEIEHLDNQIKGGTTVVMALVYNHQLYVANVGDSRALLCSYDGSKLIVEQLSKDHNTSNDEELRRLAECGLDPTMLRRTKRLGYQQNTRSIGDYSIKGGYADVESICKARREPGTAEPYISRPIHLNEFRGFLVLMSDGLYEAYETWTGRPLRVNEDIAHLVAEEMKKSSDLSVVAQNVVEKVKHLFRSACKDGKRSGRLDDITLIVRNFGYPMAIPHTQSYPDGMPHVSSAHSGAGGSGHPSLHSTVSYPSHMASQQAITSGYQVGYGTSGQMPYSSGQRGYGGPTAQPFMSLAGSSTGSTGVSNHGGVLYSIQPNAGMAPRTQFMPQISDNVSPSTGQGYDYRYGGGGGGGGYPANYPHSNQMVGGASGYGQQRQQSHPPVGYVNQPPSHPEYSKRSTSIPVAMQSPEHRAQYPSSGLRHEYENIASSSPLKSIAESPNSQFRPSPSKASSGVPVGGGVYENVTLRSQQTLQPAEGPGLQTNRYSDSCLNEKVRDMSIENPTPSSSNVSSTEYPARPHSAEPTRPAASDGLASISALPSTQPSTLDQRDEDMLLYGWSADDNGSQLNSMSTLKSQSGVLSSSEVPSLSGGTMGHPSSLGDNEARTPMNVEARELGSANGHSGDAPESLGSDREAGAEGGEDDDDGEEGVFMADVSDMSEASGTEGEDDQINPESGEIRPYIKTWGNFPFNKSWEEV